MSRDEQDEAVVVLFLNLSGAIQRLRHWLPRVVQQQYGKDAVMLVLAADHLIQDQTDFNAAVASAMVLAQDDYLVTSGWCLRHQKPALDTSSRVTHWSRVFG